jgi:hypothetical protein
MFIIAIVLGAVITSVMVANRGTSYNSTMMIALVGQHPDLVRQYQGATARVTENGVNPQAANKAKNLSYWTFEKPKFLEDVVEEAQLTTKHPDKTKADLAKEVRKKLSKPTMVTDTSVSVQLNWPTPAEANAILTALFNRFRSLTVDTENATLTNLRDIVQKQFEDAETKANKLAKDRIEYQTKNYNAIPAMMTLQIGRAEQSQAQLEDAKLDLSEAEQRFADISVQIQSVPPQIVDSVKEGQVIAHPEIQMAQEYDDLQKKYKELTAVYSPQHPKVIDLQKQMTSLKQQIDEATQKNKVQPPAPQTTAVDTTRISNPEYRDLMTQKRELERTVKVQRRKVTELSANLAKSRSSIQVMPNTEIEWQRKDSDYQLADQIRRSKKSQLELIKLDLDRDVDISGREVALDVPPAAEKADAGGKMVALVALGPMLGLVIAFCFSLLVESLDHTLRTPVEVEKYLNKPVLAVIPKMATARESHKQLGGSSKSSISS